MNLRSLSILLLVPVQMTLAQGVDTAAIIRTLELEYELDSLRGELRRLDSDLQGLKSEVAEGGDWNKLLASLDEEDGENVPEDQRSKRKRVDALLKAITARPGQLRFNGGATTILQGKPSPSPTFTTATGSFDIYAHTSFGNHTLLFFNFEAVGGNGPDRYVPALASLNGDAGSTQDSDGIDRLTVAEAWAEFSVADELITVTAGKIDLTNYFDNNAVANDETSQFLSAAFVNSSALPTPGSTPGLRVRTALLRRFYLQAALVSADNSGDDIFRDVLKMGSVGFRILPESAWEGTIRIYGYLHPSAGDAAGYGLSLDQSVAQRVSLFARWTRNDTELARWFGIRNAWSAGGRLASSLFGRKLVAALAYGRTSPAVSTVKSEQLIEIYVRHHLNTWSHVSPHVQHLWNARGTSERVTVVGLRSQFNF